MENTTCSDSNAISSPGRNSVVFDSLWVRKDTNFCLNYNLLGNPLWKRDGGLNRSTGVEDRQGGQVFCAIDVAKKNCGVFRASFEGQHPVSYIRKRTNGKNEDCNFDPAPESCREVFSPVQDVGKYRDRNSIHASDHDQESEYSKQSRSLENNCCISPSSTKNREPESSNQNEALGKYGKGSCGSNLLQSYSKAGPPNKDGTPGKLQKRCRSTSSTQSRASESSNQDDAPGKYGKDYCGSNLLQSYSKAESSNKDGTSGKFRMRCRSTSSTQSLAPESSIQDEVQGKYRESSCVSNLSQSYKSKPSDKDGTSEKIRKRSISPCSNQGRAPESSNHDGRSGENLGECLASRAGITQSNAPSNADSIDRECPKDTPFDGRVSPRSDREHLIQNRTEKKRSKQSYSVTPRVSKRRQCGLCPKSFSQLSELQSHRRTHAAVGDPFQCKICDQIFTSVRGPIRHMKQHRPALMKKCKTCGKQFRHIRSLRYHEKLHRKWSGPHSCEGCGRHFSRKVFLDRHLPNCQDQ